MHPSRAIDASERTRPTQKKVQHHIPSPVQLRLCQQHTSTGETKRALERRVKEHKAATRRGELEKSAIAEHAWSHHHQMVWGKI
jgi:hypothetical protein